jgi:ketosteroid isomerase-like protein
MSDVHKDFDPIAVVVDWLDACRKGDLAALLDLYAGEARLECVCEGIAIQGRQALEGYWRPRLNAFVPTAFGLKEIEPAEGGVVLDYSSYAGEPVRIVFNFSAGGKILQTRCGPVDPSAGN